jgi:hypothetical protein
MGEDLPMIAVAILVAYLLGVATTVAYARAELGR